MLNMEHPEYLALKKRLMSGWRTYNVYSVLSHVRMEDGLALNVAVKEYAAGNYLKEALIGRHQPESGVYEHEVEEVQPGLHAYDGSYTQATVQWMGMEFSVESTQDGKEPPAARDPGEAAEMALDAGIGDRIPVEQPGLGDLHRKRPPPTAPWGRQPSIPPAARPPTTQISLPRPLISPASSPNRWPSAPTGH